MLKEDRQRQILSLLYSEGQVSVTSLAEHFNISCDTIRRDLLVLEKQQILKRVYGGAIPFKVPQPPIGQRRSVEKNEKYEIAKKALSLVRPDSLIAIDGGTTNVMLASMFPQSISLCVVTNSFPVVTELCRCPRIKLIFVGGRCTQDAETTIGASTLQQISAYHFDQCFLGTYCLNSTQGAFLPLPGEEESFVKRSFADHSDEVNIMCSSSKLDRAGQFCFCMLTQIDRIISELPTIDAALQQRYQCKII